VAPAANASVTGGALAGNSSMIGGGPGHDVDVAPISRGVYCLCKNERHELECADTYFSLIQCDRLCPRLCAREGLHFNICDGSFSIGVIDVLRRHFKLGRACAAR